MSPTKINYDKKIFEIVSDYKNYFDETVEYINFPKIWEKEKSFEIEIKKSFLRGIIRYSRPTISLIEQIRNISNNKLIKNDNLNWISLPYPMIHLPGDKVESGVYHYDYWQPNFYTCWIPLMNYEYNSISYFRYKNKFIDFISPLLIRSKFCDLASSDIKGSQGNIFFWDGRQIHRGNFNTSNKICMAVQLKLTKNIYLYEQTSSVHKSIKEKENYNNLSKNQIQSLYSQYYQIIKKLKNYEHNIDDVKFVKLLLNSFQNKSLSISFALSLLSQRLMTHKKLFGNLNFSSTFLENLDLTSMIMGSANLISLDRLKKKHKMTIELKKLMNDLNIFNSIPFNTYQFNSILNNQTVEREEQFRI